VAFTHSMTDLQAAVNETMMSLQDPLAQAALSRQLTRPQRKAEGEASF